MTRARLCSLVLLAFTASCGGGGGGNDNNDTDGDGGSGASGGLDGSGGSDAGGSDAGGSDAGGSDAGGSDAGASVSTTASGGSAGAGGSTASGGGTGGDGGMGGVTSTDGSGGMGGVTSTTDGTGGTSTTSGDTTTATTGTGGTGGVTSTTDGTGGTSTTSGDTTTATTGTGGTGGTPVEPDLAVAVFPDGARRQISPRIYGVAGSELALSAKAKLVKVDGGTLNDTSGYNWEVNATHISNCNTEYSNAPLGTGSDPGAVAQEALSAAATNEAAVMLPIPIGPRVAADSVSDDVRDTTDYLTTRFRTNVAVKGAAFDAVPDTGDDFVYQDEFVNWVMTQAGTTPAVFVLDKHTSIWEAEVCLIHPDKASYQDIVAAGVTYAKAIKGVWSDALVAGPASYGWPCFTSLQLSPDFETEGPFLDYYLAEMAAAEDDEGYRLLDYFDIHWWPEVYRGADRITGESTTPEIVAARLAAPRSLWDPTYEEGSWVNADAGGPIELIPRIQESIEENYPGTMLSLSAWDYGGHGHVSGAIAAADVLGILGRRGVDLAAASLPDSAPFTLAAFGLYLNYDGAGSAFGDMAVIATVDDLEGASAYASVDSDDDTRVVIVVLNKRDIARDVTITLDSDATYGESLVYELAGSDPQIQAATPLTPVSENVFLYEMPAFSAAVIVPQLE